MMKILGTAKNKKMAFCATAAIKSKSSLSNLHAPRGRILGLGWFCGVKSPCSHKTNNKSPRRLRLVCCRLFPDQTNKGIERKGHRRIYNTLAASELVNTFLFRFFISKNWKKKKLKIDILKMHAVTLLVN